MEPKHRQIKSYKSHRPNKMVEMGFESKKFNPEIWTSPLESKSGSTLHTKSPFFDCDMTHLILCLYINFISSHKLWEKEYYLTCLSNPLTLGDFFQRKDINFNFHSNA